MTFTWTNLKGYFLICIIIQISLILNGWFYICKKESNEYNSLGKGIQSP